MRHTVPYSPVLRALLLGALGVAPACGGALDGAAPPPELTDDDGGTPDNEDSGLLVDAHETFGNACTNPTPLLEGADTGIYRCTEGYLHRKEARECPSRLPRDVEIPVPEGVTLASDDCATDADCPGPNDRCAIRDDGPTVCRQSAGPAEWDWHRYCDSGCRTDADCGRGAVCVCGEDIGTCVYELAIGACLTDADCEEGALCLQNSRDDNLDAPGFACQLRGDACNSDRDCAAGSQFCRMGPTGRSCQGAAVCGRPYVIDGAPRLANVALRGDWCADVEAGEPAAVDAELGAVLAEHYTRIGLMEHASVAAFARFTLQLLAVGAPLELVQAATVAQGDELRHAALAFGLARRYGGVPVGPASLALEGALEATSPEAILRTTIAEGCVGETRAALEAAEGARRATDARAKRALEGIAGDEGTHAALAWKVVRWLLARHPELVPAAREQFARALGEHVAGVPAPVAAEAHGMLAPAVLARVYDSAARDVIAPCAEALFASLAPEVPAPRAIRDAFVS